MKPVTAMTDAELQYVRNDCFEAARAYVEGHKSVEYIQFARQCEKELEKRDRIRQARKMLKHLFDPLKTPFARWSVLGSGVFRRRPSVCARNLNGYERDRWRTGAWLIGGYRLYGII